MWVGVDVPSFEAEVVAGSAWRDLSIDFDLTEPAFCEMDVLDSYGRFVARISTSRRFIPGAGHLSWNLRVPKRLRKGVTLPTLPREYQRGEILPPGVYTVKARFRATYSSRKFFTREVETKFEMK